MTKTVAYSMACLHTDATVSYVLNVVLWPSELVANLHLRGYKNDVGSKIWESHIHERLDHIALSEVLLKKLSHPVDSIRKLATVSATRLKID